MADLQQIFGAILRDLAKARFSADLYSRSIASYYEGNDLLRKFPVPRADIDELAIDLKFSIAEVQPSEVNFESREANSAAMLERSVERLVSTFLNLAYKNELQNSQLADMRERYITKGYGSKPLRMEMRRLALKYFVESYSDFVDDNGDLDVDKAMSNLERPFRWAMENFAKDEYRVGGDRELRAQMKRDLSTITTKVAGYRQVGENDRNPDVEPEADMRKAVEAMSAQIKAIWSGNSDARLEVMIEGSQLAQLSEAAISQVNVKMVVRNLVWNEVTTEQYQTRRELTPE